MKTWGLWQKITTGIISTLAALAAVYGAFEWIDNFVDEAEAGEMLNREANTRELGDLSTQVQIINIRLDFFYGEADYRDLTMREQNQVKTLEAELAVLAARSKYLQCSQSGLQAVC